MVDVSHIKYEQSVFMPCRYTHAFSLKYSSLLNLKWGFCGWCFFFICTENE